MCYTLGVRCHNPTWAVSDLVAVDATTHPGYQPNEPELSIEGLNSKVKELHAFNQHVVDAQVK